MNSARRLQNFATVRNFANLEISTLQQKPYLLLHLQNKEKKSHEDMQMKDRENHYES